MRIAFPQIWFLICTDLVARGIDFKGVALVINFDLPPSTSVYIHRIGRTGRAGKEGKVSSLLDLLLWPAAPSGCARATPRHKSFTVYFWGVCSVLLSTV